MRMKMQCLAGLVAFLSLSSAALAQVGGPADDPAAQQASQASPTPQPPESPKDPGLVTRPSPTPRPSSVFTPEGKIHLDVMVADTAGKALSGLGPQDFTLLDDGRPRKILSFRSFDGVNVNANPPVRVFLVFDTVNLPFQQVSFARQELEKFLHATGGRLAQPVSLILMTDAGMRVQPRASTDGNALATVLDQIKGGLHSVYTAMGADGDLQRFQLSLHQMELIADNSAHVPGRKLLIWIGPGWPMMNSHQFTFSDKDQSHYFENIVQLSTALREARMVVYSVTPVNVETDQTRTLMYRDFLKGVPSPRKADTGNLALKVLAIQSGGRILGPDNHLAEQIDNCIADANAFYTISFNPSPAEHADEYHDLKVVVDTPGASVRTNSGYYNQPKSPNGDSR